MILEKSNSVEKSNSAIEFPYMYFVTGKNLSISIGKLANDLPKDKPDFL